LERMAASTGTEASAVTTPFVPSADSQPQPNADPCGPSVDADAGAIGTKLASTAKAAATANRRPQLTLPTLTRLHGGCPIWERGGDISDIKKEACRRIERKGIV
jgi:hypothetical protein